MSVLDYVQVKQGTQSTSRFSHGNTYPLVACPFGLVSFAIQTRGDDEKWFYSPYDRQTEGVRLTHIATPWLEDYAHLAFIPQNGKPIVDLQSRSSGFRPEETVMRPDELSIGFLRDQCRLSLTPTERGACMKVEFQNTSEPRFTIIPQKAQFGASLDVKGTRLLLRYQGATPCTPSDFTMYIALEFDVPAQKTACGTVGIDGCFTPTDSAQEVTEGYTLGFPAGTRSVQIKMATSYISVEQALCTLKRETGGRTYEQLRAEASELWERYLLCVRLQTKDEEQKRTFYSCLYRMFLFPRKFYEENKQGEVYHYSCGDGKVHPGIMYTDNGFWDTFRTVYPFFALVIPDELKKMLEGYIQYYKESGWMPKWLNPGEWGLMPGTLIDAVIADAAAKGLLRGKDLETALEGLLKHATIDSDNSVQGRHGTEDYLKYGYVPAEKYRESANHTMDYVYGDFCIARVAEIAGNSKLADEFYQRADNYKKMFDSKEGFLRGRNSDGSFPEGFDPCNWGDPYCEGGAWQNGFSVFHDLRGLDALYGDAGGLCSKLMELFDTPPMYNVASYGFEIHEMTEMAALDFGQCAISNQPSFHLPYIFTVLGHPEHTAEKLPQLLSVFKSTPDGFPGDEDNGSMSGWYVFSTLGLYPVTPGTDQYVRGIPMMDEAVIRTGGGELHIRRKGSGRYVKRVLINGKPTNHLYFTYDELNCGGVIEFLMTENVDEARSNYILPYSMNDPL
ncbi:MAG: GH92 family glycosyl hydrolase [Oscillospiraceae bacterium]|nr:GH92 family glycosyl hydrolase [Oscillospiraceae bacterium]